MSFCQLGHVQIGNRLNFLRLSQNCFLSNFCVKVWNPWFQRLLANLSRRRLLTLLTFISNNCFALHNHLSRRYFFQSFGHTHHLHLCQELTVAHRICRFRIQIRPGLSCHCLCVKGLSLQLSRLEFWSLSSQSIRT